MTVTRYAIQLSSCGDGSFVVGIVHRTWKSSAWRTEKAVMRRAATEADFLRVVQEVATHMLILESERLTETARP